MLSQSHTGHSALGLLHSHRVRPNAHWRSSISYPAWPAVTPGVGALISLACIPSPTLVGVLASLPSCWSSSLSPIPQPTMDHCGLYFSSIILAFCSSPTLFSKCRIYLPLPLPRAPSLKKALNVNHRIPFSPELLPVTCSSTPHN